MKNQKIRSMKVHEQSGYNYKAKVFGDAVDLLMGDMEKVARPRGVQMVPVKNIQPFHDHPFHLYEGERLEDMIASVKEHGVLNPVIVQKFFRSSWYQQLTSVDGEFLIRKLQDEIRQSE